MLNVHQMIVFYILFIVRMIFPIQHEFRNMVP